jgi:hypothetical protein
MLDKLLKNKSIRSAFLNQFKTIIKEQDLKAIVININDDGELVPTLHKDEIKVLTVTEYNNLINSLKSNL